MRSRLTSGSFMTFLSTTVRSSPLPANHFYPVLINCSTVPVAEKTRILGVPPLLSQQKVYHFKVHLYGLVMLIVTKKAMSFPAYWREVMTTSSC